MHWHTSHCIAHAARSFFTAVSHTARLPICMLAARYDLAYAPLLAAIAAGCLPVVIADELKGAFATRACYSDYWVRVNMKDFIRHPEQVCVSE